MHAAPMLSARLACQSWVLRREQGGSLHVLPWFTPASVGLQAHGSDTVLPNLSSRVPVNFPNCLLSLNSSVWQ